MHPSGGNKCEQRARDRQRRSRADWGCGVIANPSRKPIRLELPPLMEPGTAEVSGDGMLHLAGADLDYAGLGGACRLLVDAGQSTLAVRHGHDHKVIPAGPRGLICAQKELIALGVRLNILDPITAQVVRHTDGHTHWLELRFPPETLKPRAPKNKTHSP